MLHYVGNIICVGIGLGALSLYLYTKDYLYTSNEEHIAKIKFEELVFPKFISLLELPQYSEIKDILIKIDPQYKIEMSTDGEYKIYAIVDDDIFCKFEFTRHGLLDDYYLNKTHPLYETHKEDIVFKSIY